jgi:phage FluMu gp28-like protein
MKLSAAERDLLQKTKEFGRKADVVREVVSAISDSIVERCKNEFSTMPVLDYQNIDNRAIIMLQLQMKVARDFKTAVDTAILNGHEAEATLKTHGGE